MRTLTSPDLYRQVLERINAERDLLLNDWQRHADAATLHSQLAADRLERIALLEQERLQIQADEQLAQRRGRCH